MSHQTSSYDSGAAASDKGISIKTPNYAALLYSNNTQLTLGATYETIRTFKWLKTFNTA
jgi:hypothetical protein